MQSKMSADNAELLEEIRKLNSKFDIMQSDFVVTKKMNSELSSRLANMGHQCLAIAHYPRWEYLEVVGIPKDVKKRLNRKI